MVGVDDAGSLLQRAGFTLLTVDSDTLTVPYPDMQTLCADLRRMGDGNACTHRRGGGLSPELLKAAAKLYDEKYGEFVLGPPLPTAPFVQRPHV
jgi:NADH dehydrogenase [ubiquinone] 1 alpha subcomplex assembly factor 5